MDIEQVFLLVVKLLGVLVTATAGLMGVFSNTLKTEARPEIDRGDVTELLRRLNLSGKRLLAITMASIILTFAAQIAELHHEAVEARKQTAEFTEVITKSNEQLKLSREQLSRAEEHLTLSRAELRVARYTGDELQSLLLRQAPASIELEVSLPITNEVVAKAFDWTRLLPKSGHFECGEQLEGFPGLVVSAATEPDHGPGALVVTPDSNFHPLRTGGIIGEFMQDIVAEVDILKPNDESAAMVLGKAKTVIDLQQMARRVVVTTATRGTVELSLELINKKAIIHLWQPIDFHGGISRMEDLRDKIVDISVHIVPGFILEARKIDMLRSIAHINSATLRVGSDIVVLSDPRFEATERELGLIGNDQSLRQEWTMCYVISLWTRADPVGP